MANFCHNCGTKSVEEATSCEECGVKLLTAEPIKTETVIENIPNEEIEKESSKPKNKAFIYTALGVFAVGLIGTIGTISYIEKTKENLYLEKISVVSNNLNDLEEEITQNLRMIIKGDKINNKFTKNKEVLKELKSSFKVLQVPEIYNSSNEKISQIIEDDIELIEKTELAISNPTSKESTLLVEDIRKQSENKNKNIQQVSIPGVKINDFNTSSYVSMVSMYIDEKEKENSEKQKQEKIEQERMAVERKKQEEKQEKLKNFVVNFDSILHRYNIARTDLGNIIDKIRTGGYTFTDFYNAIDQARETRKDLRNEIVALDYINSSTENVKKELSYILTKSIDYCEVKRTGIKIEQERGIDGASYKYAEADSIDLDIKTSFQKFTNDYNTVRTSASIE